MEKIDTNSEEYKKKKAKIFLDFSIGVEKFQIYMAHKCSCTICRDMEKVWIKIIREE